MKTLEQRSWLGFKKFTIEQDGLRLECKQDNKFLNTLVEYEQIGKKEVIVNEKGNLYGIIAFVSVFFNVMILLGIVSDRIENTGIFSGITGGVIAAFSFWGYHLFRLSEEKFIEGPYSISFFYSNKKRVEVDQFIKELQSCKTNYLRNKFMKIDRHTSAEQLKAQFIWLKQGEYISDIELNSLMEELANRRIIAGDS